MICTLILDFLVVRDQSGFCQPPFSTAAGVLGTGVGNRGLECLTPNLHASVQWIYAAKAVHFHVSHNTLRPGPEVIKLFSCLAQLKKKFQLLIKTKIETNEELSCFKSVRCCIYNANKC